MTKSGWENVDNSHKVAHYINLMDRRNQLESIQRYAALTYEVLALTPGSTVLDVGCGTGDDVIQLARMVGTHGHVVGIDFSEQLISEARKRAQKAGVSVEFCVGDADDLAQFADGSFDATRAAAVFHHLHSPQKALQEMIRLTRPGGRVVIAEADWETLVLDHPDKIRTRQIMNSHCDTKHQNGWIGRQLPRLFKQEGLDTAVTPGVLILPNFQLANTILGLDKLVQKMQQAGLLTLEDAHQWWQTAADLDEQGLFMASLTGFITIGKKAGTSHE